MRCRRCGQDFAIDELTEGYCAACVNALPEFDVSDYELAIDDDDFAIETEELDND